MKVNGQFQAPAEESARGTHWIGGCASMESILTVETRQFSIAYQQSNPDSSAVSLPTERLSCYGS
jgi:hypothetical protein